MTEISKARGAQRLLVNCRAAPAQLAGFCGVCRAAEMKSHLHQPGKFARLYP